LSITTYASLPTDSDRCLRRSVPTRM
jgi:hypothetical protein